MADFTVHIEGEILVFHRICKKILLKFYIKFVH